VYIRYAIYFSSLDVRVGSNSDVCAVNLVDQIGLVHAYPEMYCEGIRKFYKQPYEKIILGSIYSIKSK
jgi:hypothetical protein